MILQPIDLLNMGLNIGSEIPQAKLTAAIEEGELSVVKPAIGDDAYIAATGLASTDPLLIGGQTTDQQGNQVFLAGLKKAMGYIAFACLIRHTMQSTNFGTVQKNDEHSTNTDPLEWARYNFGVGTRYLREVAAAAGWPCKLGDTTLMWNL